MNNTQWPWLLAVLGFIVLGIAIAYGMSRNRRRTPVERQLNEMGSRKIYREEEVRTSERE